MNASVRELARREQDGLEVTLFWNARSNDISIQVIDRRADSIFWASVASRFALDAFHHPYVYALAPRADSERADAAPAVVTR